jgi:hypothetical protein
MQFSPPSLHPPVIRSVDHKTAVETEFSRILAERSPTRGRVPETDETIQICLTTVSLDTNFDAYIDISFEAHPGSATVQLLVDSGNSVLVVPFWETIEEIPNSNSVYHILGTGCEPWGCPANIVHGPINIPTTTGCSYTLEDCVFYACTGGPPSGGDRTANFGIGCLLPWTASYWNRPPGIGVTMQAPLAYNSAFPFAELDYAPSTTLFAASLAPTVARRSYLKVHKAKPSAYTVCDIVPQKAWMSLLAKGLSIRNSRTTWPDQIPRTLNIAMIDTGGGPVFLSDPEGCVYNKNWPNRVSNPWWTSNSVDCNSISADVTIVLGDSDNTVSYNINESLLPRSVQGLTLVMCKQISYMRGEHGMNTGGLSALANLILIDYEQSQVGLKSKVALAKSRRESS